MNMLWYFLHPFVQLKAETVAPNDPNPGYDIFTKTLRM